MKRNLGGVDRIIRLVLAGLFLVLYFMDVVNGTFGIVLLILAGILILTSLVGTCGLYLPFGINSTCPAKEADEKKAE